MAEPNPSRLSTPPRVALPKAAKALDMSAPGALKLFRRTGRACRDNRRWFVNRTDLSAIKRARATLFGPCAIAERETTVRKDPEGTFKRNALRPPLEGWRDDRLAELPVGARPRRLRLPCQRGCHIKNRPRPRHWPTDWSEGDL